MTSNWTQSPKILRRLSSNTLLTTPPPGRQVSAVSVAAESTATECHDVLNQVYGLAVDADDLYTLFRETYQTKGELPSKFLMRLDENLTRAINVGAVGVAQADNLRLAQFIRGLIHDELLCSTLNLKHRKPNPPSYLTLIKEVRNEEINSRARAEKRNTQTTTLSNSKAITAATTLNYDALSHEVDVLREELDRMKSTPAPTKPFTNPNPHTPSVRRNNAPNKICYNCGESGHHMRLCTKPTNAALVQRKLADRFTNSGNARG
ncbi:uncharacterized protein LOC117112924 [Anneissia japonica]|uniref:uncharacterized protein LOC117112924 n=1 Tax=Anneissia japonica TaxID=1529436 RepID=UPI001425ADCE|nr:uncharacterized protein LOC117112924 [Anneissia japonica]